MEQHGDYMVTVGERYDSLERLVPGWNGLACQVTSLKEGNTQLVLDRCTPTVTRASMCKLTKKKGALNGPKIQHNQS